MAPSGLVAAASGLWMQASYELPKGDGDALAVLRVLFGAAMFMSLVLGLVAISRRDFVRHGAWMLRGHAIGLGEGTQVLTHVPWVLLFGAPGEGARALLMGAGWVINVAVAERIIRRSPQEIDISSERRTAGRATASPGCRPLDRSAYRIQRLTMFS